MPKCANCGTELDEGAKFCLECGTPVPQTKKCIKCGFELPLSAKFCPECGTKQDGQANPNAGGSGLSMGDKNVIAGDVIGHKEETHIAGNATIIKNEDQTKQVKKCHICGSLVPIIEGFDCKECGQFTCTNCFDTKNGVCKDCVNTIIKRNEEEYKNALKMALADGRIEFAERNQLITLQQKLNISQDKAAILEQQLKGDNSENYTTVEKLNIDNAYNLFYKEQKSTEAFEIIKQIFNNHQKDEKILNIYIPLLAETDGEQALSFINSMQVDILMAYITAIDIALKNDDLDEAERKYKQAARIWPENALVKCYQVLLNYALYKKFKKQDFLNKAKELVENLGEAQNELELSMQVRVQMFMQEVSGETIPEITKQFCEDNQLYWTVMNKQLFEDCFKVQASEAADCISKLNSEKCTIKISGKITEEQSSKLRESLIDKKDCKIALDLSNSSFEDCSPYFNDCTGLTNIKLPDSVTEIGSGAFAGCTGLTSINIPKSVTEIAGEVFSGCTSLSSITIPDSVTRIGEYAFEGCKNILITVSPANKHYCSLNGIVYHKSKTSIIACSGSLKGTIAIPDSVTEIGSSAFSGCTGLTSITIPDSVTKIKLGAFSGCTGLTSINIPDSVTEIGRGAFSGCTGLTSINIPKSVTGIGMNAFSGCTGLTSINIPKSVTVIGTSAFSGCTGLTSITIPDSVSYIKSDAFRGCTGLTGIIIPDSVTKIESYAFSGCTSLISINIPDSVTTIEHHTFFGCTDLTSINIPNSVTEIKHGTFQNCTSLTSINIPESVTQIGRYAFDGCKNILITVSPANKYYCSQDGIVYDKSKNTIIACSGSLKGTIAISDSVTKIGSYAFSGCTGLTRITIPDSVTYIEDGAFKGCTGLTSINISASVTEIESATLCDCTGLTRITIPDSVSYIADTLFEGCTSLMNVSLPDSITNIYEDAFKNCPNLRTITIPKNCEVEDDSFDDGIKIIRR